MGLMFLTGVVSGLPFVETVVAFITEKLLEFHIAVVNFFGSMEYFLVKIPELFFSEDSGGTAGGIFNLFDNYGSFSIICFKEKDGTI